MLRFESGSDLTLEEILLLQTSFESDWRFDGFDGIEFDDTDHECYHDEDEKIFSDEEQFCQTSIEEKAECDQHVETFGSETESRLSEQALCSNRKSPKRQYSNPKSEDLNTKPVLLDDVPRHFGENHMLPSQISEEFSEPSRVPLMPKESLPEQQPRAGKS